MKSETIKRLQYTDEMNRVAFVFNSCVILAVLSGTARAEFPTVALEHYVSRNNTAASLVYPYQPFDLVADIYIKDTPDNRLNSNPFIRAARFQEGRIPIIFIRWADDKLVPKGIRPTQPWEMWIRTIPVAPRGFSINRFTEGILGEVALFAPESEKVERTDSDGNKCTYWKYSVRRRFFADRFGDITLEPVEINGIFADVDPDGKLDGRRTQVKTEPLTIQVSDAPAGNRPKDYTGLIGEIDWNLELNPKRGKIREPLTLTVTFSGTGSVLAAQAPDLMLNPLISEAFSVYPPTEEVGNNSVKYSYTIRPKKSGQLKFPEITASYFNVNTEKYITLKSSPISIMVQPGQDRDDQTMESVGTTGLRQKHGNLERSQDGIFANFTDASGAVNRKINASRYLFHIAALVVAYCMVCVVIFAVRIFRSRSKDHSRIETIIQAREQWNGVKKLYAENKPFEACVAAHNLLMNFIAQISNASPSGLTWNNIAVLLKTWSLPAGKMEELESLFNLFEAARFGAESVPESIKPTLESSDILETLIKSVPKTDSRANSAASQLSILLIVLSFTVGCREWSDPEAVKIFKDAIAVYDKADEQSVVKDPFGDDPETTKVMESKKKDFRSAAAMYQSLLDRGIESGPILYNCGNAWFRAGEPAKALASYRKAKRYMPTNPYLESNLKSVMITAAAKNNSSKFEYVFLGQNHISYPLKFKLAIIMSAIAFGVAVLSLIIRTKTSFRITFFCVLVAFVSISSAIYDWYRFEHVKHGVVILETLPRKGNSLQYGPALTEPLKICTEFVVLDQRANWIMIRLVDGEIGWIPLGDAVVY